MGHHEAMMARYHEAMKVAKDAQEKADYAAALADRLGTAMNKNVTLLMNAVNVLNTQSMAFGLLAKKLAQKLGIEEASFDELVNQSFQEVSEMTQGEEETAPEEPARVFGGEDSSEIVVPDVTSP